MQAIVFAEGGSLRLRPLTEHLPTCLVPVGGTPILDHQIQTLLRLGVGSITVVGGYRAAQVEQACRHYVGVLFRVNPRFSRAEPLRSSLLAAAPEPGCPVLLVRGDLVFDEGMVRALLTARGKDAHLVGPSGRGIGLCRISGETAKTLLAESGTPAAGGEPELFPWVEGYLAAHGGEALGTGERPWARVSSLEDLARALKAGRESQQARVAEAKDRFLGERPPPQEAEEAIPLYSDHETVPQASSPRRHQAPGGSTVISRSLLRVFPR
jgi:hypothetical protein